jgi:hypothetical protein
MTVLPLWCFFGPKMIVRDQMFIDFVDVGIVWHTEFFGKIFYINKINKLLNSDNHFGLENSKE